MGPSPGRRPILQVKALRVGKIKVDINASVTKSWTSELGIETGGRVKAHSTVYGDYGIVKGSPGPAVKGAASR